MKIVKFEADWCQPCKALAKVMEGMDYTAIDIETEDGEELARSYGVRGLPTLMFVADDGEVLGVHMGLMSRNTLDQLVEKYS